MEKNMLKNRLYQLQKSVVEHSLTKDTLYKEAMKFSGVERVALFQAASQHTNKIAFLRKEINSIYKQLKKSKE